jgi:hypothetical protein
MQVLYPAATMGENFIRAGLMMLLRLAFIAMVGIFASTFLSFPVAVLLVLVIFSVGHLSNFIFTELLPKMFVFQDVMGPPGTPIHPLDTLLRNVLAYFFWLFPNFSPYDIVPNLTDGHIIEGRALLSCFLWLPFLRGGVLALAGWYIFRRRELAALTATS